MAMPEALALDVPDLEQIAREMRAKIVAYSNYARLPHLGSCLSSVDILTCFYFSILKLDPKAPTADTRDRFVLSKGHGAPALYQVLAHRGFYPESDLFRPDHGDGLFGEHPPAPGYLPGVEAATGSLGHGLPMGVGMALAARVRQRPYRVFALLSDGECNEGSIWEAAMFAAAQKLETLSVVVDYNKWQATGRSDDVMALAPLVDKWRAFGWDAEEVDGHDMAALSARLRDLPNGSGRPVATIAHTVKGKGVSFMEDDNNWHYRVPNADEVEAAHRELAAA